MRQEKLLVLMSKQNHDFAGLSAIAPIPIQIVDGAVGHEHFSETSHITDVLVGDYHVIQGEGSGLYMVWSIRIVVDEAPYSLILLYKRYSDIEAFRLKLVKEYPKDNFPLLPAKDSFSVLRIWLLELWLEARRKGLQWFLTNVLLNPKYQHSPIITSFVLS